MFRALDAAAEGSDEVVRVATRAVRAQAAQAGAAQAGAGPKAKEQLALPVYLYSRFDEADGADGADEADGGGGGGGADDGFAGDSAAGAAAGAGAAAAAGASTSPSAAARSGPGPSASSAPTPGPEPLPPSRPPPLPSTPPAAAPALAPLPEGRKRFVHGGAEVYQWEQSLDEVLVFFRPPPAVRAADLAVRIEARRVRLGLRGVARPFLDEALGGACVVGESLWTFEPPPRGAPPGAGGELTLTLTKAARATTWESAFAGHGALGELEREAVRKRMLLERFGEEHRGFDFSGAQINGAVPDPRVFMDGPGATSNDLPPPRPGP